NGCSGSLCVSIAQDASSLRVDISFPDARWLFQIIERVRRIFDLTADPRDIAAHLSADPFLVTRVKAMPGVRVPGCWDGFELAVRAILGQQVSVAGANTLACRLVRMFGKAIDARTSLTHVFPTPEALVQADVARVGLPEKRAEAIRALAQAVIEGRICFDSIMDFEDFQSRLCGLPGVGKWTAQYIAMRALGDPDAFPASDLGLLRSASFRTEAELAQRAKAWPPWSAYSEMDGW